jgi:hypothetical protein
MSIDMNIVYTIGIIVAVLGMVFGIAYLRKNKYVSKEDLQFVSTVLGIGIEILDEMNLSKEKELLKISSIVQDSLNFAVGMFDDTHNIYIQACNYAFKLCEQADIELTDNRRDIIQQLIRIGLEIKVINE